MSKFTIALLSAAALAVLSGFAGFTDGGKDVVKDMSAQCYQCHASQEPRGYVFSQWRP